MREFASNRRDVRCDKTAHYTWPDAERCDCGELSRADSTRSPAERASAASLPPAPPTLGVCELCGRATGNPSLGCCTPTYCRATQAEQRTYVAALRAEVAALRSEPNAEPEALLLMPDVREAVANLAYRVALDSLGAGLDRATEVRDEWRDVLRNPPHWTDRGQAALIVAMEIRNALRAARSSAAGEDTNG